MWLEANVGTDSAGANPIKAMSAKVSARRGLRAILFIGYSPVENHWERREYDFRTYSDHKPSR
jgi:hypothetical protein